MRHAPEEANRVSDIRTPAGHAVEVVHTHDGALLSGVVAGVGGRMTVVVTPGTAEKSVNVLGALWDTLVAVAGELKKLFQSCTPHSTTHVNVDSNGNVTSIVTTYTCVPD